MKILDLQYKEEPKTWELLPVSFHDDLTLLVGLSGVGKTRILNSLASLGDIASGDVTEYLWGDSWRVTFLGEDHKKYVWSGAFEQRPSDADDDVMTEEERSPRILREELADADSVTLFRRTNQDVQVLGRSFPKISAEQSLLKVLSEEDSVAPASAAMRGIILVDISNDEARSEYHLHGGVYRFHKHLSTLSDLAAIRSARLSTLTKYAIASANAPAIAEAISQDFRSVFPHVQAVTCEIKSLDSRARYPDIRIKESGVSHWIPYYRMSAGMQKTFTHIARLHLLPDGAVVLIDEFENSLSVNCIDIVIDRIKTEGNRLQFILTSHHPYIINTIDFHQWKIVEREGSRVSVRSAEQIGIGRSKHEAFIQLLNSKSFREGIRPS